MHCNSQFSIAIMYLESDMSLNITLHFTLRAIAQRMSNLGNCDSMYKSLPNLFLFYDTFPTICVILIYDRLPKQISKLYFSIESNAPLYVPKYVIEIHAHMDK